MQRGTGHTRIKKKLDKIGTKKPEVEQSILTLSSLYLDEKAELKTKLKAEEESTKDTPTCLHTMYSCTLKTKPNARSILVKNIPKPNGCLDRSASRANHCEYQPNQTSESLFSI